MLRKILVAAALAALSTAALAQNYPALIPAWASTGVPTTDIVAPSAGFISAGWPLSSTPPPRQYFNWLDNWETNAILYYLHRGPPDWNAAVVYGLGDIVASANILYESSQNSNTGNTPSSGSTIWTPINTKTAANGDNSVSIATTAFVHNNYLPLNSPFSALSGQIGNTQVPKSSVVQWQGSLSIGYGQLTSVPASAALSPNTFVVRDGINNIFVNTVNFGSVEDDENVAFLIATNAGSDGYGRKTALSYVEGKMTLSSIGGQVTPAQVPQNAVTQYEPALFGFNPSLSPTSNGWITLPGGMLFEWGYQCFGNSTTNVVDVTVNFPKPFPSNVFSVTVSGQRTAVGNGQALNGSNFVSNITKTNFTATLDQSGGNQSCGHFMAIGD